MGILNPKKKTKISELAENVGELAKSKIGNKPKKTSLARKFTIAGIFTGAAVGVASIFYNKKAREEFVKGAKEAGKTSKELAAKTGELANKSISKLNDYTKEQLKKS